MNSDDVGSPIWSVHPRGGEEPLAPRPCWAATLREIGDQIRVPPQFVLDDFLALGWAVWEAAPGPVSHLMREHEVSRARFRVVEVEDEWEVHVSFSSSSSDSENDE